MQFAGKSQLSQIIAVFVSCVVIQCLTLSTGLVHSLTYAGGPAVCLCLPRPPQCCPAHHPQHPLPSGLLTCGEYHSHHGGAWRTHHSHPRSAEVANGDQL